MKVVFETAVKTRILWLLSDGSLKDFLRDKLSEGQSKICHWKEGVKVIIVSILGYQEELVRLCKPCYLRGV